VVEALVPGRCRNRRGFRRSSGSPKAERCSTAWWAWTSCCSPAVADMDGPPWPCPGGSGRFTTCRSSVVSALGAVSLTGSSACTPARTTTWSSRMRGRAGGPVHSVLRRGAAPTRRCGANGEKIVVVDVERSYPVAATRWSSR